MRFAFIEEHHEEWPVTVQCRVLEVSRSGYYAWRNRPGSKQAVRREALLSEIRKVHRESRRTYGSPRIYEELKDRGVRCSENMVAGIMKQAGIRAKTTKKFRRTTDSNHAHPIAQNLLGRQFHRATAANQDWASDITYIPTRQGWLYLAVVEDLYSRKIVGWAMSDRMTSRLVVDALQMALDRERPGRGLLHHSDRGSQYAGEHYQRLLECHGITCSMSRKGNCWDNAVVESFFSTLKKELIHHEDYLTRTEARQSIFEYIEVFYNRVRRHSALNYKSPIKFLQAA